MSGFAALWWQDGMPVGPRNGCMELMLDTMAHRGPDGRGVWHGGNITLGHLLLHTTPESLHERQPVQRGKLCLSGACRIDNRTELLSQLDLDAEPATISDAGIILRAYERWGESCVDRLLGDFAFALWDGERQTLFCARDPMGVEPFYYARAGGRFACASELRALLALPEIEPALDEEGIAAYLLPFMIDAEVTLVRHVKRLPGGHTLTVDRSGSRLHRYWAPDPEQELRLPSDEAYAEALREVLFEAVRCRLRSARPLGAMLSGGLDSSSVACIARSLRQEAGAGVIPAVSVLYPDQDEEDERRWIEAVLAGGSLAWHPIPWRGDILPLPAADVSFFTAHLIVNRDVFRGAVEAGIRVLLGGEGGDHALSWGHIAHTSALSLMQDGEWRAGAQVLLRALYRRTRRMDRVVQPTLGYDYIALLTAAAAERLRVHERHSELLSRVQASPARVHHARRLENVSASGTIEADAALAAWHGLEVRSPFWDRRVLELCLSLPLMQKEGPRRSGTPRIVLRRAMNGVLPSLVQWRQGKWAGHAAVRCALRHIRDDASSIPGTEGPVSRFLNPVALRDAWASLDRPDVSADRAIMCWSVAALDVQVRSHGLT